MPKFVFPLSKPIVQTMLFRKGKFSANVIIFLDRVFYYFGRHSSTRTGRPAENRMATWTSSPCPYDLPRRLVLNYSAFHRHAARIRIMLDCFRKAIPIK